MEEKFAIEFDASQAEDDEIAAIRSEYVDPDFIESIWEELDGQVSREQIRQVVLEAEEKYRNAAVQAFVPIFMRQYILKRLQEPEATLQTTEGQGGQVADETG